MRNTVPSAAGACVADRVEVPGFAPDNQAEFNLPIGLIAISWDKDVVKRTYDSVCRLEKQHWFCRHRHAGFLRMIREIQPHTHDFARPGNRRRPTVAFAHLRKPSCFIGSQESCKPLQPGFGKESRVPILKVARQIPAFPIQQPVNRVRNYLTPISSVRLPYHEPTFSDSAS